MARSSDVENYASSEKLLCMKDVNTEPFEINDSSNEAQVDAVLQDTEVLYGPECVEDVETQLLDVFDAEVVPDSDDEMMDFSERKHFSSENVGFVESSSPSFSPSKQQGQPVMNTDACVDDGHVSGRSTCVLLCKGNYDCHVTVQSKIQPLEMHLKDIVMSEDKGADLVNSSFSSANRTDDYKQLTEHIEVGRDVGTGQWKRREVHIVYKRKKKTRSHGSRDNVGQEATRAPNINDCAGLSYVDSQEPVDLSNALLFLDKYISVNAMDSSPLGKVTVKDSSPPVLSAKGVQSLVRSVKLRDRDVDIGVFEWDQSQDTEEKSDSLCSRSQLSGGTIVGKTYVRRSPDLKNMISKKHGKQGNFRDEKTESCNKNELLKDLAHLDTKLPVCNIETAVETNQINEKKAMEVSDPEQGLQGQAYGECEVMQQEAHALHNDLEKFFDVGIDTQIAVEAIQELSFAAAAGCSIMDADKCQNSLGGTENTDNAGVWSFPRKARSASRRLVAQSIDYMKILRSDYRKEQRQMLEVGGRNCVEKSTRECLDKGSSGDSDKQNLLKKAKRKGIEGVSTNVFKKKLNSSISDEDAPLCKLKRRRKQRDIYPLVGGLTLTKSFDKHEAFMNESTEGKIDHMKIGLHDKRRKKIVDVSRLEVSAQVENSSKLLCEKSRNSENMKVSKDDRTYAVLDGPSVNAYVDGIHLLESDLHDKGNKGSITDNMLEFSRSMKSFSKHPPSKFNDAGIKNVFQEDKSYVLGPDSWFLGDYLKGKRACSSMLCRSVGFPGTDDSSAKTRKEQCRLSSLRSQCNSASLLSSFFVNSNVKRKRRSSVYISPCWFSSKTHCNGSFLSCKVDLLTENHVGHNRPTVKPNNDFGRTVFSARRVGDEASVPNKTPKPDDLNHVKSPNCPLRDETNLVNVIDGCREQAGKKNSTSSPLTRELVKLGFNESIPEFTSKDCRRRKTMANIRVLLSQNLDRGILKQMKKILIRFGVPMVSCPSAATHFIADKFARTRNMLEFIAQGKPVVTHMWLESCDQAGSYIDERNYILRDVKKEQELRFKLPLSLDQARQQPLLKGYKVFVTPNSQPGRELLTSLVKAAHGQAVDLVMDCTKTTLDDVLILSCEEDQDCCVPFLKRGVMAYSPELILNGIIIQKLEFERHRLFTDHVKGL